VSVGAPPAGLRRQALLLHAIVLLLGILGLETAAPAAPAPAPAVGATASLGPIVQFIDTQDLGDHTDITIQFACSARYVSNTPTSHGTSTTITLNLGSDCGPQLGPLPPQLPLVGGGGHLVTGARVDSLVPGQITVELTWSRPLDFVMAPTASGLGMRVRLLDTTHRKAEVFLSEPEQATGFAVNLDSSKTKLPAEAVEAAAAKFGAQAYVSETDIEGEHWYRLRLGPFSTRKEAERVLQVAQASYARAWLAVNDELTDLSAVEHAGVQSAPASEATDPPLPDAERTKMLHDARSALEKHQYPEAVDLLTRLVRQPEFPARAECQELMGLVRERAGQLAQAKAAYEEYLRRYPDGAGAARVRARLQTLAAASLEPKSTGEFAAAANNRWTLAGSAALSYQYGKDQNVSTGTTSTTNSLNSGVIYGDLLLRDRGERYDLTGRVNAGYTYNVANSFSGGSQDRATAAYVELVDKNFGLTGRLGRQSLASQGIVGLFDGVFAGYQASSKWSVSGAAGLPAYTSYSAVSSQQKFGTVTAEFDPFHQTLVFDTYFFDETTEGFADRRSIGLQTRYFVPGRTAVMLVDYDVEFKQLNSGTLIGNSKVGEHWVLGFDVDHRKSPLLQLTNALIGQNASDLTALQGSYNPPLSDSQLRQLAIDRTATSNTFDVSATRPFGERWQFTVDVGTLELTGTPASAGVPATLSTGLEKNALLQLTGSSLLQTNDLHIFSVRGDESPLSRSTTLSWDARFVLPGAWRLGPRLSVEELNDPSLGGRQTIYLPQLRGDWTSRRSVFEVIGGYTLTNQTTLQQQPSVTGVLQTTSVAERSLYFSVSYRVRF
jgi:hypothetical protein